MRKFAISILLPLIFACCMSCAADEEGTPDPPTPPPPPPEEMELISIAYLKSFWEGHPVVITKPYMIRGRVMSSDREGNFHHSLILQDGTAGIEFLLERDNLYMDYLLYSYVEVSLTKLTVGAYGGFVQLGTAGGDSSYQVDEIPGEEIDHYVKIYRPDEVPELEVAGYTISQLSMRQAGTLVRIDGVQFVKEEIGLTWGAEDETAERTLMDATGATLKVRTSPYADFGKNPLPSGSGFLEGILYVFNGEYSLRLSDIHTVFLDNPRFDVPRRTEPPTAKAPLLYSPPYL